MQEKSEVVVLSKHGQEIYQRVPPEGGWGYLVAFCIVITFSVTFIPFGAFGIIFGNFLESHGDQASATGLISGTYLAFQWSSGIIANPLLQKISYRKVAVLGTFLLLAGAFSLIFVTNVHELIISFSILQGLGFGLIICSSLTAFNCYFEKRRNFILSASNALMMLLIAVFPSLVSYCMKNYGFKGTLLIIAGINLNCLPAVLCLQPAKWHMKKSLKIIENKNYIKLSSDDSKPQNEQTLGLLNSYKDQHSEKVIADSHYLQKGNSVCLNVIKNVYNYLDLGLFLDPVYVNATMGLSLCLASDYSFVTTLPLLLTSFNLETSNVVLLLTVFYTADVVARILLSILNAFTNIDARKLTLLGAILAIIVRTMFVMDNNFWWLAVCTGLAGSLRCLFQVNYALIIADLYKERFVAAFSLFLVVCGIISFVTGVLIGVVKTATESNVMVVHLLTAMYAICSISWLVELFYTKFRKNRT